MTLTESYAKIKRTVVAFVPKFLPVNRPGESAPEFPPIFGTGFIIDEGVVVTNDHVIRAIARLPRPRDCPPDVWPVNCLLWHFVPEKGMATIPLDVLGVFTIDQMETGEIYYGPPKPDVAFVQVKMKGLPKVNVKFELKEIKEGQEIATAGFPMGTEALTAPGYLHQLTPTLQKGIISAVLPFECETPHAIMINVMVQGGASGSPVFLPDTGDVIGVLYAGLQETRQTISRLPSKISKDIEKLEPSLHSHVCTVPANISYVVPAHYIEKMLHGIKEDPNAKLADDTLTLDEYIIKAEHAVVKPREPLPLKIWKGTDTVKRTIQKTSPDEVRSQ